MKKLDFLQTFPLLLASLFFSSAALHAQTNLNVYNASDLSNAVAQASQDTADNNWTDTITLQGNISATSQFFLNANVDILGNGYSINMNNADRAFFIAGGTVGITNLTIQNGFARGGDGGDGGGGGAGLGGAIFVGNGSSITGANVTLPTVVTLGGINFTNNAATGGNGGTVTVSGAGGGGGMGGNGGAAHFGDLNDSGGGGGGGFGVAAGGGTNAVGSTGAFLGAASGGTSGSSYSGGINGGGGGGANGDGTPYSGSNKAGGGGGVGGNAGSTDSGSGGNGGFGGGGGGSGLGGNYGGKGGFGGGGGAGNWLGEEGSGSTGGNGGFGGGGGFGVTGGVNGGGSGGFGAGGAASDVVFPTNPTFRYGGGGLGAGGAVFVMNGASLIIENGSFGGNAVNAGLGSTNNSSEPIYNSQNGSAYGADLFLGADVTFNVGTGNSLSVNSLGGAGNTNDPNVTGAPSHQLTDAAGGVIKIGGGDLKITGTNYYTGSTVVKTGGITLASNAVETGTTSVVLGQSSGDNGTLVLASGSRLIGGSLVMGQSTNSSGTLIFGAGNAAAIDFGTNPITTGPGGGTIVFAQTSSHDGSSGVFEFTPVINGNISILQGGTGTTRLAPGGVSLFNNFTGSITIESGTLEIGNVNAIPNTTPLIMNGGTLNLNGYDGFFSTIQLNSGVITNSGPGPVAFTAGRITTSSGQIHAPITGVEGGSFVLDQSGSGTTLIASGLSNILGGNVQAEDGNLVIGADATLLHIENLTTTGTGSITIQGNNASQTQNVSIGEDQGGASALVLDGGKLKVTGSGGVILGSSGSIVFNSATSGLDVNGINAGTNGGGTIVFTQSDTITMNIPVSGAMSLAQNGPGTTILQTQFTNGNTTINAGTLQISSEQQWFNLSYTGTILMNGGTLNLSNASVVAQNIVMNGGTLTGESGGLLDVYHLFTANAGVVNAGVTAGSFVKNGAGTLTVSSNTSAYGVQVNQGTLSVAAGGLLQSYFLIVLTGGQLEISENAKVQATNPGATCQLIVGQNNGDNATLALGSSSILNVSSGTNPAVMLGQSSGATGTIVIGSGTGSSGAYVGANVFQGGAGGGSVIFRENYAAGSSDPIYPFYTALTGNLKVVQDGLGTTLLKPLSAYGPNTFTGGVVVNQGILQLGTNTALPIGNDITLNGGIFDLNGNSATAGIFTLRGGTLTNSSGNQALTFERAVTTSGNIAASIGGSGGLTQQGNGTTTITVPSTFTGGTVVNQGTLLTSVADALGGTTNVTVTAGGILALSASNSVNSLASLTLSGGKLEVVSNLSQTLGNWTLENTSIFDFAGYAAAFSFSGLAINGSLSIWNWNALTDSIGIIGAYSGDLSLITFYSDSGTTQIGTGEIVNNQLQAIPEPSTYALVGFGALLLVVAARRRSV